MHQVESFERCVESSRQLDRTGVVDQDVDPAEPLDRRINSRPHLVLETNIGDTGQRLSPGILDLLDRRMNRPRQFRMRLIGLGHHGDGGPVASGS